MTEAEAPTAEDPNRRPLKTRGWVFFRWLAARLAAAGVSPNAISLSSIVFACLAGGAFVAAGRVEAVLAQRALWLAAAACIQLRLIANLLDGMVAIEGGKKSPTGGLYNEAPDRVADAAILLGAGWAPGGEPWLGMAATIVAIFVAYVRALGASLGVGQVFLGPMAKPHRMAILTFASVLIALWPTSWSADRQHALDGGMMKGVLAGIVIAGLITAWRRLANISRRLHANAADAGIPEG